jgi:hypothetical protein
VMIADSMVTRAAGLLMPLLVRREADNIIDRY